MQHVADHYDRPWNDTLLVGPSGENSGIIDLPDACEGSECHGDCGNKECAGWENVEGVPRPDLTNWPTASTYPCTTYSSSSSEELVVGPDPAADVHVRDASPSRKPTRPRGTAWERASYRNGTAIPCYGPSTTEAIRVEVGRREDEVRMPTLLVYEAKGVALDRHCARTPLDCLTDDDGPDGNGRPLRVTARFSTHKVKNHFLWRGTSEGAHWRITFEDMPPGKYWLRVLDRPYYHFEVPKGKKHQ